MPSIVDCPSCTRKLRVTDELVGRRVKCPTCGEVFEAATPPDNGAPTPPTEYTPVAYAPGSPSPGSPAAGSSAAASEKRREFMRCPYCNERIDADSRRCRFCGEDLDDADECDIRRRQGVRRDCEPHRGTLVLVLGIVSLVINHIIPSSGLFLGIPAWIMGKRDLRKIDRGEMDPSGRGATQAGYICGIIGTILGALYLLFCAAYFAFVGVMITTAKQQRIQEQQQQKMAPAAPNNPPGQRRN